MNRFWQILGFWTVYGIYAAWQTHYRSSFTLKPYSWGTSLFAEMTYAYLWALCTPAVVTLCRRWKIEGRRWLLPLALHIVNAVALSCLTKLLWDGIMYYAISMRPLYVSSGLTAQNITRSLNGALDIGLTAYLLIAVSCYAADYYERYRLKQREALQLERELAQAELRALKMQLHPHFLFNTLHAISALVADSPKEAEQMIVRLSDMLRLTLDNSGQQELPLEHELRFLNLYLDIERMRFAERLEVTMQIEPGLEEAAVPNLILQPLVENSIRHGIERMLDAGKIAITARRQGEHLVITVADNGAGLPQEQMPPERYGVGLRATRGRLERLYGPAQSLVLRRRPEGGVEAIVTLPLRWLRGTPESPALMRLGAASR